MTELSYLAVPGTVYFIGAGPGAPDLITVRGRDLIAQADLILYADSLVAESVAQLARKAGARIVGSADLHLEQILALMVETARSGGVVARVHSGDPALYGAIYEQITYLEDQAIPYEVTPGVTAAFAVAARLKTELTIPDLVQTIILTRTANRTPVPAREELRSLAAHGASMAIYLSVNLIHHVVDELLASGGYGPDTPAAVVYRATWPDESRVLGTLGDIAEKVRAAGYTKHALILVSPALEPALKKPERRTASYLYDRSFTHLFRQAETDSETAGHQPPITAHPQTVTAVNGQPTAIVIGVTRRGSQLAVKLAAEIGAAVSIPDKFGQENLPFPDPTREGASPDLYPDSALDEVRRRWPHYRQLILVMPAGVAVRAIAPLLSHKSSDPAVVCLDEAGQSVIPLLGGHQAGANALARRVAVITGGYAAVTTASDVQGKPALDLPPSPGDLSWRIDPDSALTHTSACLVNDEPVGIYLDPALTPVRPLAAGWLGQADNLTWLDSLDELTEDTYAAGIIISHRTLSESHVSLLSKSVLYHPPVLVVGMGCKRDVPAAELRPALEETLAETGLAWQSMAALATVDLKADEPGLHQLADELGVPLRIVERAELMTSLSKEEYSPSAAQEKFDLPGVAEPCAVFVSGGELVVPKRRFARCTVAIALKG